METRTKTKQIKVYLLKVISIEDYSVSFSDQPYVKVEAIWKSYGWAKRRTDLCPLKIWKQIEEAGYYLS